MNTKNLAWLPMVERLSPRMRIAISVVVGYWCLLFAGTHIPAPRLAQIPASDKVLHWVAYGVLAFLVAWLTSHRRVMTLKIYAVIFAALAYYGILDELSQGLPFINRHSDFADWLADVGGILSGLLAQMLIAWKFRNWAWVAGSARR